MNYCIKILDIIFVHLTNYADQILGPQKLKLGHGYCDESTDLCLLQCMISFKLDLMIGLLIGHIQHSLYVMKRM